MLPTSVTKATSVLLPEVEAAASEVASVVVLVAVLAEEPPQAARESAMLAAITKARNFFMVLISLGCFSVAQRGEFPAAVPSVYRICCGNSMKKDDKKNYKSITKRSLLPLSAREVPRRGGALSQRGQVGGYSRRSTVTFGVSGSVSRSE